MSVVDSAFDKATRLALPLAQGTDASASSTSWASIRSCCMGEFSSVGSANASGWWPPRSSRLTARRVSGARPWGKDPGLGKARANRALITAQLPLWSTVSYAFNSGTPSLLIRATKSASGVSCANELDTPSSEALSNSSGTPRPVRRSRSATRLRTVSSDALTTKMAIL